MDLQDTLALKCPIIFRDGCLVCGLECPPGWERLVLALSQELERYAKAYNPDLIVEQVKPKFGGLRYYVSPHDPEAEKIIMRAEAESFETCEECGKPGKVGGKSWVRTLCPSHAS